MITVTQLLVLGFKFDKQYKHDHYYTNRYRKDILEFEFTYDGDKCVSADLTIDEVVGKEVTLEQLLVLTSILT